MRIEKHWSIFPTPACEELPGDGDLATRQLGIFRGTEPLPELRPQKHDSLPGNGQTLGQK